VREQKKISKPRTNVLPEDYLGTMCWSRLMAALGQPETIRAGLRWVGCTSDS
jgi:hypothetical protein